MHQHKIDFEVLLNDLKKGQEEAFNILYRHSRHRLYVLALYILKDESAAQDLVQELFIDLWVKKLYKDIESSLRTYLIITVRNRAYNLLEKQNTHEKLKKAYLALRTEDLNIRHTLENEELGKKIESALSRLPPTAAKVFRMHYVDKLSHMDIANNLKISKSTVSSHIDRALKQLRVELGKEK